VALDLPGEAREALVEWRRRLEHPDLRLVAPEALHVTLVFLGHLPEEEIPRIAEAIAPPPMEAPVLTASGVKPVPPRRPRLFALDLDDEDGRAGRIQGAVSDALVALGLYEPEKRPFWPHVTLARVRKGGRVGRLDVAEPPSEPWAAEAVTLYRSRLSPKGARYEPLRRVGLN
jgi:RNA 2',3'-cyclic 3'-phosphodiesterase